MWEANDAAWTQHPRHLPECHYLLLKKGKNFVDSVRNALSHEPSKREEENEEEEKEERTETSEKQDEEQQIRCKVCYTESIEVVLLPCRHFVACTLCTGVCESVHYVGPKFMLMSELSLIHI